MFSLSQLIETALSNLLYFALHFESNGIFPKPLSSKEEADCFQKAADGDSLARNRLIEHNLRLVAHITKKYYQITQDHDDLISIGTIGLIKAVDTFDYTKGNRFATYGSRCIENEILMHFRANKKAANDLHFDEPIDTDKDGNQLSLIDIIADEESVLDGIDFRYNLEKLFVYIDEYLDPREKEIIILRYGLFRRAALTQKEVAKKLKISRSYVSRIEKKAIEKLREHFECD